MVMVMGAMGEVMGGAMATSMEGTVLIDGEEVFFDSSTTYSKPLLEILIMECD